MIRRFHAAGDRCGQSLKIFRVPGGDGFGAGLERAVSEACGTELPELAETHAGEDAVDFGKAEQATARVTFLAADKKIEACLVVRLLHVQQGDQHGSIEETISLGLPGIPAIGLLADITERFCGFIGGHAPAGAEDPDALLAEPSIVMEHSMGQVSCGYLTHRMDN